MTNAHFVCYIFYLFQN